MPEPTSAAPHADAPAQCPRSRPEASAPAGPAEALLKTGIQATLLQHLRENYLPRGGNARIDPGEDLFDAGILDSAAVLSVVLFIEHEFAITIPDEDLLPANVASVDAAVAYIMRRLASDPARASQEAAHDIDEEVPRLGPR